MPKVTEILIKRLQQANPQFFLFFGPPLSTDVAL